MSRDMRALIGAVERGDAWAEVQRRLNDEGTDPVEFICCLVGEQFGTLTYNRSPPRMLWTASPPTNPTP